MDNFSKVVGQRWRDFAKKKPDGWTNYLKNVKLQEFSNEGVECDTELFFFSPVIYFLMCNGEVVYVGQSTCLMARISQHIQENTKIFTSFKFIN